MTNVIVIGAGVIGAACAWRLAQAGVRVTLLERHAPASGASQAALGVLQFHAKLGMPPSYQRLALHSRELFPSWLAELAAVTGAAVPYSARGHLSLALAEGDWEPLNELSALNSQLSLPVERMSAEECRLLEPGLTPHQFGGLLFPADAWVDNTALTVSLAQAAEACGARFVRVRVDEVRVEAGRATGVSAGSQHYSADWVVLAAGCWSGQIGGVPSLPVAPVRGQALAVDGQPVRSIVSSQRGYLVPKGDTGQTLVGATVERVGFDDGTTLGGLADIAAWGLALSPGLRGCPFLGAWAGLRPGTPDGLPCIGPFAGVPNLIAAAGHMRNGILQAPSTAEIVLALIGGGSLPLPIEAFGPDRPFTGVARE